MPNLCDNRLTIWCDDELALAKLADAACEPAPSIGEKIVAFLSRRCVERRKTGFLQFLCPMPENVEELAIEKFPESPREPKSYYWRLEHWGCRNDFLLGAHALKTVGSELCMEFPTDYSAPVAALQHGASLHGFRFRLLYCESGGGFCGIATEVDNQEYELMFDQLPSETGVPEVLVEQFRLDAIYREMLDPNKEGRG